MNFLKPILVTAIAIASVASAESVSSPVLKSEFVFESDPCPSVHASTIEATTDGTLVTAFFGGTKESANDVGIWVSRRLGEQWEAPREVLTGVQPDGTRFACWNPVLFQPRSGDLMLFYKVGPTADSWWGMLSRSRDNGATWSPPVRLPDGVFGPVKNKPVQLPNGDLLSGSSSEHDGWKVHFERSTDGGKTWEVTAPVNDGLTFSAIQPSILFLGGDRLMALGRTRQKVLFQIHSEDLGKTWGEMTALSLPNPNSGTDAVTLRDGRHLLVFNNTEQGRTPLELAISSDGENWKSVLTLEDQPGEYSYPAIIQTSDDLVHVTYTWKRKRIKHVVIDPKLLPETH
ncbi:sialidase family protein [Planctomicrobium sp. SH661]|uniref:sialidase family protein n=1 Tax=Planctomicrobium sp. SH661 TaxID=3448124 RepID=UPI003F5BDDE6